MSVFMKDASDVESATQLLELLQFACQLASLLITVLNDDEIYEKGDPVRSVHAAHSPRSRMHGWMMPGCS